MVIGALMGAGIAQPAQAQAVNLDIQSNNIIADGRTRTNIDTQGAHTKITTETISGDTGFNSFTDFEQAAGTRVDLYVPDGADNLLNIVTDGTVLINGELNGFKNGEIGGNIFFSSSNGFIVGQNGTVNVGSLSVNTPTGEFLERVIRADGTIDNGVAHQLMTGEVPMSANGHIAIMGEVNAQGGITLQGRNVSINSSTGALVGDDLSQRMKFDSTVNADEVVEGGALLSYGGKIEIVATGETRIGGRIDASAAESAGTAGEISVTGGDITVESTAEFAADGNAGGDIIVFAGGTLVVEDDASFTAAALALGDGGFVELSGQNVHIGSIDLDLSSQFGSAGNLLVDPFDLFIGGVSTNSGASDDFSVTTNILSFGANILLQADNSITVVSGGVIDSRDSSAGVSTGNSGSITLEAPMITLEDGSQILAGVSTGSAFTGGDVTFTATQNNGGTALISVGQGGVVGPEITGRNITFNASSTVDQSSVLLAIPTANAGVLTQGGTITATGTFASTATANAAGGLTLLPLGVVVTNVDATVDVSGDTVVNAGAVNLTASATVVSSILTQSLAPANSSADGAVAVSTINSTAIARIGGSAELDVAGGTTLDASNTITSKSDATPQQAAFGASVAVSVVDAVTTAEVADDATLSTASLTLDAATQTNVTVNAVAGAGGATEPSPGSQATTYLSDAKYGGQAETSEGGVSVAGALGISDLSSVTNARINATGVTTVTGDLNITSSSDNAADVTADGTAVESDTGVGIAVGINIAKVVNDATINSAVSAGSVSQTAGHAAEGNKFSTSATSGAGAADVGIAGSFALNLIDTGSVARISGPAVVTVSGDGAVSLASNNETDITANALPSDGGATGDNVGVGASVAMNILANRSVAEVADGGTLTGVGDLTLSAKAVHSAETKAEAGSSGGISLTPALGLSMINNTTMARLGTGGTQVASGAIVVSAAQRSTITTDASGEAAGSKAAVGAALALALVDDRVMATSDRNIDADGAVTFTAAGASLSTLTATASAVGAASEEDGGSGGGDVDTTATSELTGASDKQKSAGVGDADQQAATETAANDEEGRSASTSEGKVSVAAAVGINVQTSSVTASIPDGIEVSAGGILKLGAVNNTDGQITATGDAVGEADDDGETPPPSKVGIGAAVAVNVVKTRNDAILGDATHNVGGLDISATKLDVAALMADPNSTATRGDVYLTRASSGAGGEKVGVAGSLALNLIDTQSVAQISGASFVTVTGDGAVTLTTDNQTETTAEALPVGGGATGGSVGVGASVAINILANRSDAEIADGGVLNGAGDLTLSAEATHKAVTKAEAGSAGDISVTPALGLSMISNATTARLGTGATQTVSGAISVSATQSSTVTTEASGEAAGAKAAIGAALALALIDDQTLATTDRNIDADGAVSFNAEGQSTSTLNAVASAAGAGEAEDEDAAPDSDGESVDKQATTEFNTGSSRQKKAGVGDSDQQDATTATAADEDGRSAETSEGKVAVGAAVAINVQSADVQAMIPDAVSVSAGGALTIQSGATTSGSATSDGQAVAGEDGGTSQVGIGVAVSVNVVNETNTARLGAATHDAEGVSVGANQATGADTDTFEVSATSGAGGSKVGIAGSVALNIVTLDTTARIAGGANVDAGAGASSITAANDVDATATAAPSDEGVTGGKVGVGASFAMNLLTTTTTAELQDGATMTAGSGLNVEATSGLDTTTEASAGAAGGIAVDASVALALLNQTTTARIGTGNTLNMGAGAVRVAATNTGANTATSTGENKSGKVGVGASASVILGNGASGGALLNTSETTATLARSVNAGSLTINASANRTYDANATATAGGGDFSEDDEKKNDTTGGTSTTADSLDKTKDSQRDQDGNKNGAKVTIAAAAGIAAAQDVVSATLEGVTVNVAGSIDIDASNTVGMTASGIGAATNPQSKVGIGVGVGLAILNNTTSATVADGATVTNASSINVAATSRENADGPYLSQLSALGIAGASGKQVSVAGALAVAISTGQTNASIGDNVVVSQGGAMSVASDNTSHLSAKALAGSVSTNGIAVGGSIAVVVADKDYGASIGTGADLTGSSLAVSAINRRIDAGPDFDFSNLDDLDAFSDLLEDLATQKLLGNSNYYVEAIGGAGGSGVAVQGSFGVMVFSDTLKSTVGDGTQINVGTGAVVLSTDGDYVAKALSGALSASTSSAAVGVSASVIVSDGETLSDLGDNVQITSAGSFVNTARAAQDIRVYAASASAASSAGVAGVATVITSENEVEALMGSGAQVSISGAGAVSLGATNDFTTFGLAAGIGAGSTAGVGAAATVVVVDNVTRAEIADSTAGNRSEINADGPISVTATATETGKLFGMAGAAGGTAGVGAGAGVYVLGTTTEALIGDFAKVGNGFDAGSLVVSASDVSDLFSVAGAAGVGGTAGAGAGISVGDLGKTTTAEIGASTIVETGNVIVNANSAEEILAITAGIGVGGKAGLAGAVTVLSATPVTTARIGQNARVYADGNVAVLAAGETKLDMIDGAFAAGTAGIGASVGVTVISATTLATIDDNAQVTALGNGTAQSFVTGYTPGFAAYGDDDNGLAAANFDPAATDELTDADAAAARNAGLQLLSQSRDAVANLATASGVIVNATDNTAVRALSVAGSVGAVGISVSASVPVITTNTTANISTGAQINQTAGTAADTQNVSVAAASDLYSIGFSGAVAAGGVAGGAGVSVMVLDATTAATVDAQSVNASGDVLVSADASQDIVGIGAAGAAGGSAALAGGVSVIDVTTVTTARLGGTVVAQGNVDVLADDTTRTAVVAGALAIGSTGIGAAVSVVNLDKEIAASIAAGASVTALGRREDHTVFTGDDFSDVEIASRGVNVQTNSAQSGFTLGVAGAAGGVGVAGVVAVYLMDVDNQATIGNNAMINTAGGNATANAAQDVVVTARDETVTSVAAGGVAVGLTAGLAGVVDVGVFKNTAAATIGNNVTLNARNDVLVNGLSNKAGEAYVIGAGGGIVGLAAGIAIYNYGDGITPSDGADDEISGASSDGSLSFASITDDAQAQAQNGEVNDLLAESDDERVRNISAAAQSRRESVDIASAATSTLAVPAGTSANIGSGTITAGGDVNVNSSDKLKVNIVTGAVAAGGLAGGAGVGVVTVDTGSTAQIDGSGVLTAANVRVNAITNHDLDGLHFAGAAGLLAALSADVGVFTDNSRTTAAIRGKTVTTSGGVAVNADATRAIKVDGVGVSVAGTLAVGASIATVKIGGAVTAEVTENAQIGTSGDRAGSLTVSAISNDTAEADTVAVGGGLGAAVQGAGSIVDVKPVVTASLSSARVFTSGLTSVNASATGSADTSAIGVAVAGGLAAGASDAESEFSASVKTNVDGDTLVNAGEIAFGTNVSTTLNTAFSSGSAGALVGLNATVATAENNSKAETLVANSALISTGEVSVSATNTTDQTAESSGLAVGLIAAGFNLSTAKSDTVTTATLTDMTAVAAGTLNVTANGDDSNDAVTVAGSGGLVAGAAASSTTRTDSRTQAGLLTTGSAAFGANVAGAANITAEHTSNFGGSVDSTQASLVGASGANIDHRVESEVLANIGDRVQLTAQDLTLAARNITDNQLLAGGKQNVNSISGGLANIPAGGADLVIIHNTSALIGANAAVRLTPPTLGPSLFKQEAYNNVGANQRVKLDSGGAIATANAEIDTAITANATTTVGADSDIVVDYGDIQIAAWGEADVDVRSSATTYGLAGAPSGDANITYAGLNQVNIGNNALVQATDGDTPTNGDIPRYATVRLGAGVGPDGGAADLDFNAVVDIFNKTAIPIPASPDPTVTVANSGLVSVGTTASTNMETDPQGVRAAGDIYVSVSRGEIDASAVGTGKDIYREALAAAASAISNAFGGGDVTFDYHGGSTSVDGGLSRVDINGRVETSIQSQKRLTIDLDPSCQPTVISCIADGISGNIDYEITGPFPVGNNIMERVNELRDLIEEYKDDPIALAAYQNEINFLQNKLVGLGLASFDAAGNFVDSPFTGPSPRGALEAEAAANANDISTVKIQLNVAASTNIVDGLTELTDGVQSFYTNGTYGLTVSVNSAITQIQSISTYSASNDAAVAAIRTLRDQGVAAANAVTVAEASTISLRNDNVAQAAVIANAQTALEAALLTNNVSEATTQQNRILAAQTQIDTNLATIAGNTSTITTQSGIARDRAASLDTDLNALLNSLPTVPVTGDADAQAAANAQNALDNNVRNALRAPGTGDFRTDAGAITRVGLSNSALATTVTDLGAVVASINTAVSTLDANTGNTAGTVAGTKSLTQFVGLLGSLTANFATNTLNAAGAATSSEAPTANAIEIADTAARLGNIFVSADELRTAGSGKLLAPGDAVIEITNNTANTLKLGNLIVPTYDAGNLRFNGVLVHSPADIADLNTNGLSSGFIDNNVVTSRTSSRGLIDIRSTYTPEAVDAADRQVAPDIILDRGKVIENTNGAVRITSEAGNIYVRGSINAGSVEILAKDGDFVASFVNGFNHIGGDPASFASHTSITEPGPGITANGAISISARFLNINSTIQSGIAEWNLTLGADPTLTASALAVGLTDSQVQLAIGRGDTTITNAQGQTFQINTAAQGIDADELSAVVEQYKAEVREDANADPTRTISIFGVATQVNIKDYLSETTGYRLEFSRAVAEAYKSAVPSSDGLFSVVPTSATDNIGAVYDAGTQQYVVNGATVKGGYIQLFGQIMNTTDSTEVARLNVLDGFGTINITNNSTIPVVLRNLSTGDDKTGELRGIEGKIEITDIVGVNATGVNADSPIVDVRKTIYTRDYVPGDPTGNIRIETQVGRIDNDTGDLRLGDPVVTSGGDANATYQPRANQRYVWTTAEEYSRTSTYSQVSTELFGSSALTVANITSLTQSGEPQLGATVRLKDGTYVTTDTTITDGGLQIVNGAAFQSPPASNTSNTTLSGTPLTEANQSYFTKNEFSSTGSSSRRCNWWTLCIASEKTYYYKLEQEYTTIVTESLKADNPIGINFIGSNTGAINVTSGANVVLTSNLVAAAGTVTINAGNGVGNSASIIQGDLAAEIRAQNVDLTATASVGGVSDPNNAAAPRNAALTVNLTGPLGGGSIFEGDIIADRTSGLTEPRAGGGAFSASAGNGNVEIISRADLTVDQVTALGDVTNGQGEVNLFSFASIDGVNQDARIQAARVNLTSLSGSIGGTADNAQLRVNTAYDATSNDREFGDPALDGDLRTNPYNGVSVTAAGDIGIRSDTWAENADGTMLVVKVQSTGGDVRLGATGQILDNNPVESIDQRTYDELLGFWEGLGLLADDPSRGVDGSVNEAKQANAIFAFESATTQSYNQYWMVRSQQADGGASYDPTFTYSLTVTPAQVAAVTERYRAEAIAAQQLDPTIDVDATVSARVDLFERQQENRRVTLTASLEQQAIAEGITLAEKITQYEETQTTEYHRLNGVVGDLTTRFDDTYRYVASDTEKTDLTDGAVWTERELAFSLAPGALKTVTGTNPVIKDPNVSGRSVTIEADRGIGETVGSGTASRGVSIRSSIDPRNLSIEQKVALAAAERTDLELTVGPVNLPADATQEQIDAYNAAVAIGMGASGVETTLLLGAEFDTLTNRQQIALNAAALGLVSAENTLLTVLSKRPLNFDAKTDLTVTVADVADAGNSDIGSVYLASRGGVTLGDISTFGETRIKVFGDITNAVTSSVTTGNLILEAAQGGIGTLTTPLILAPRDGATTTARAQNDINIAFTETGVIDTVYSPKTVQLTAQDSLLNAQNDDLINVLGKMVDLQAVTGSIGSEARSLNVGVGLEGKINATAAQEINLFGPEASRFVIGSATAGSTVRLGAFGESIIDGVVQTPGDILLSTGGRQVLTSISALQTSGGLVDINAGSLKMLTDAVVQADVGRVVIATTGDAQITGITSGSTDAAAVSVVSMEGAIIAGNADPRTDIEAMATGAGVFLQAGLGIGQVTQTNVTAEENVVTDVINPLRIRTNTLAAEAEAGDIELAIETDVILTDLTALNGAITVIGDGSVEIDQTESGGTQTFTAQDALSFDNLLTNGLPDDDGDIILASVNSTVTGGSLNAAGDSNITGNGVIFDTIIAGNDSIIISTGDIIGVLEEAGDTIRNIAGFGDGNTGILDVQTMRARNIELQATDTLDVGVLEVGENLILRADIINAPSVTQVPSGPLPLNITLTGPNGVVATKATISVDAPAGIVMPDLQVSESLITTTADYVEIQNAYTPLQGTSDRAGTMLLTTPSQVVFSDSRSVTPKAEPASNVQLFQEDVPFQLTVDGNVISTNSFVVTFDVTNEVTDVLGVPFEGISLERDSLRRLRQSWWPIIDPLSFSDFLDEDVAVDGGLDISELDDALVVIDGIEYSVLVRGDGPAVLLRQ